MHKRAAQHQRYCRIDESIDEIVSTWRLSAAPCAEERHEGYNVASHSTCILQSPKLARQYSSGNRRDTARPQDQWVSKIDDQLGLPRRACAPLE